MSGTPEQTPIPTPEPTPTPSPTPAPDLAPESGPEPAAVEAPKEEGKTLATEPVEAPFDAEKLTLPEGYTKSERFDQFTDWAKEAGINQSQAEKLIALYAEDLKHIVEADKAVVEKMNADWINEVKADKELGGANLAVVKQTISKVLDNPDLADPKLREALDVTGAGNHPAVIRSLYRMAQKLTEGASVAGQPPARNGAGELTNQPRSIADAFYGPEGPRRDTARPGG